MRIAKILFIIVTACLVVGGHVGLWRSDAYSEAMKLRLTALNALGWTAILLPAFAVSRWARLHRTDKSDDRRRSQRPQDPDIQP